MKCQVDEGKTMNNKSKRNLKDVLRIARKIHLYSILKGTIGFKFNLKRL